LLEAGCPSEFADNFADAAECQTQCLKIDGATANSGYSLTAKGNNLQCRLLHISKALVDGKPADCAAAVGASPCK
jgi:hypothetical protein